MRPDLWRLYPSMLRARLFEEAARALWLEGLISGELHLGVGEEGIVAGIAAHLQEDDALALDHRGTPPMVMIGVDIEELLRELLGHPQGLCGGQGGHMHLFSPRHRVASSGIVGAAGPTAAGFALSAQMLRPGSLAVAYFGEGALNQGMLLESLNLAVVWKLPVLFVCKDNGWSITTRSPTATGGDLIERAKAFGLPSWQVEGWDVEKVWEAAGAAIKAIRKGSGPAFLLASCLHLEGHFLGDPLLRVGRQPVSEAKELAPALARGALGSGGAPPLQRAAGLGAMTATIGRSVIDDKFRRRDPVARARKQLAKQDPARLNSLEEGIRSEVDTAVERTLAS